MNNFITVMSQNTDVTNSMFTCLLYTSDAADE